MISFLENFKIRVFRQERRLMLSEVRHIYLQLMPHATMLYFCVSVINKTQGSVQQAIIIIINH